MMKLQINQSERCCAYCGKSVRKTEKEHVFPKCLYPPSKVESKVQRLTIPACHDCNNSWSDEEVHFRNILSIAGDPNPSRSELFNKVVMPSFDEADGIRRANELLERIKPVMVDGKHPRYMVYPIKDEKVIRVVKKVVRSLCYHHNVVWPISDQRVWADILKYEVPKIYFDSMVYHHWEHDIAEYRYAVINENDINSAWLTTFYEEVTFICLVSMSESGF